MVSSSGYYCVLVACAIAAQGARAQSASQPSADDKDQVRETIVIRATGSQVELPADYAGRQISRGGRIGLFGNLDMMDTPFNATNYTAQFIQDQQANSVADVVQSRPRCACGTRLRATSRDPM